MSRYPHFASALAVLLALGACENESGNQPAHDNDAGDATGVGGAGGASGTAGGTGGSSGKSGSGGSDPSDGSSGNAGAAGSGGSGVGIPDGAAIRLPPENAAFDYQLGGAYPPPSGVTVVSRDRTASPAAGVYNICYLNGFQVQPGEEGSWDADLILRDASGNPIIDPDWNEMLLDVSTADKRARIAAVVGSWIERCASDGFDAVEIDNLDTYSRSGGRITQDDAVSVLALLSTTAHGRGLSIAQKNSTDLLSRKDEMGTDFAVAEECSRYDECADYVGTYGKHVLMIEYRDQDFRKGCQIYGATHSIVLRDLNLVPAGRPAYVFEGC